MDMKIKVLERVEDCAILVLPIEGFEDLSLKDKILTYYLWHASIAGDRITYDQNYRYGIKLRDFFLDILEYRDCMRPEAYNKILLYAKQIIMNHGNHDVRSTAKFIPKFTARELEMAVAASSKKGFKHELTDGLRKAIFDPSFDVMLTQKSPKGGDIITESKNTLYKDVTLKDLEGFADKYPLNSTVVKENGRLVEKVWRAGDSKTPQGMYADELKNIVKNLREASKYSDSPYKKILEILIKYFETGDPKLFDDYNIAWLKSDSKVDAIIGFIEQYLDARGFKGLYEGVVFFKDEKSNAIVHAVANSSQHLEDNAPWIDKYKKKWTKIPLANAVTQVMAAGGDGPIGFIGVNLPNAQWIREKYNSKNFYLSNITYASKNVFVDMLWDEFIERKEDAAILKKSLEILEPALVTLHEVVGHGSGKSNPELKGDPRDYLLEHYSALEEARAELCALYHIWDEKLIKDKVFTLDTAKGAYINYVLRYLVQMRRYSKEDMIHEDHERATSMIIRYALEKGSCAFYKKNGKTYTKVIDYKLMRQHIGELLSEIMRIKAEGDYAAGKALVEKYGIYFDLKLRDEIVNRAKKIDYPSHYAYVMHRPELVRDKTGKILDVKLVQYKSLMEQGKDIREKYG